MEITSTFAPATDRISVEQISRDSKPAPVTTSDTSFKAHVDNGVSNTKTSQASNSKQDKALHELAVVITQQFISEIMKEQIDIGAGDGMQADFQKSMFVKAVSEQLVETDALKLKSFLKTGMGDQ